MKQPTIAINGSFLQSPITGVQRYAHEVIKGFRALGLEQFVVVAPHAWSREEYFGYPVIRDHWPFKGKMWLWEQVRLPCLVQRTGATALWSPCNTGPLFVKNHVVTIHDASVLDHPEWFSPGFRAWYRLLLPRLGRRARLVLTDSTYSRGRLIARLNIAGDRIRTIDLGGLQRTPLDGTKRRQLPALVKGRGFLTRLGLETCVYVLAVNSADPRKNIDRLLQAWRLTPLPARGVQLLIAGGRDRIFAGSGTAELPPGVRMLGYVTDLELAELYSHALAFVYPSLYEGYGLPPIEAMSYGVPVVASNTTSLPDVLADAVEYVDPYEPESIANGLTRVTENKALRDELSARGLTRAGLFDWLECARETACAICE